MSYRQLYDFAQNLEPPVRRNDVRDHLVELNGLKRLPMVITKMDHRICRGAYLSARNTDHRLVQQCGGHVILVARDLPKEWERFIYLKETMHTFDDPDEATDTGDAFENLLRDLAGPGDLTELSKQLGSEVKCFWKALAVLCPEPKRQEYAEERNRGHIDDYELSLRLRFPEQYVPNLFREDWSRIISIITEQIA